MSSNTASPSQQARGGKRGAKARTSYFIKLKDAVIRGDAIARPGTAEEIFLAKKRLAGPQKCEDDVDAVKLRNSTVVIISVAALAELAEPSAKGDETAFKRAERVHGSLKKMVGLKAIVAPGDRKLDPSEVSYTYYIDFEDLQFAGKDAGSAKIRFQYSTGRSGVSSPTGLRQSGGVKRSSARNKRGALEDFAPELDTDRIYPESDRKKSVQKTLVFSQAEAATDTNQESASLRTESGQPLFPTPTPALPPNDDSLLMIELAHALSQASDQLPPLPPQPVPLQPAPPIRRPLNRTHSRRFLQFSKPSASRQGSMEAINMFLKPLPAPELSNSSNDTPIDKSSIMSMSELFHTANTCSRDDSMGSTAHLFNSSRTNLFGANEKIDTLARTETHIHMGHVIDLT